MKTVSLFVLLLLLHSCSGDVQENTPIDSNTSALNTTITPDSITADSALRIADKDARLAYGDLSIYDITIKRSGENWLVDYNLRDKTLNGGGPHYTISVSDGKIVSKVYEQ